MNNLFASIKNCTKVNPDVLTKLNPTLVFEFAFDIVLLIVYIYLAVPVTGQSKLSD